MSSPTPPPQSRTERAELLSLGFLPLALAAFGALLDVSARGTGLSPLDAFKVCLLWLLLAVPVAVGVAVSAVVLDAVSKRVSWLQAFPRSCALTWLVIQVALILALSGGLLGIVSVLIGSVAGVLIFVRLSRASVGAGAGTERIGGLFAMALPVLLLLVTLAPWLSGMGLRVGLTRLALSVALGGVLLVLLRQSARARVSIAAALVLISAALGYASDAQRQGAARATQPAPSQPHVVLIVLDTQRADYLGFLGSKLQLTPNLDRVARDSTVYSRCFAAAGWTVPSHASLFTGLYPTTHGASFEHHRWLDDRFQTIAEGLHGRGYHTAAFVANEWVELSNELQGFDLATRIGEEFADLQVRPLLEVLGFPARFMDHGASDGVSRLERYLHHVKDVAAPQFLFINLIEPHWRYLPPLSERLAALPPDINGLSATRTSTEFYGPLALAGGKVEPRTRRTVQALYAAAVRYQDERFGQLLDLLDKNLGLSNTLLIVTADHGENLGEGGRYDHVFALNDALIHVPMLFRYPKLFPPGKRDDGLCSQLDVSATLRDVVPGFSLPASSDARSLVPGRFVPRTQVFAAGDPYLGHLDRMSHPIGFQRDVAQFNTTLRAVRDEHFKYIESSVAGPALYDLEHDPDEVDNVLAKQPAIAAGLRAELSAWLAREPAYKESGAAPAASSGASSHSLDRLRSLGYVQ